MDPRHARYCAHIFKAFDLSLFRRSLDIFHGCHDFRAFANRVEHTSKEFVGKSVEYSTIKKINSIDLIDEGKGYFRVDVDLESALYRMVRNIVGASFSVAYGELSFETLVSLLETAPCRQKNKAHSAPPEGLCLERVYYDKWICSRP